MTPTKTPFAGLEVLESAQDPLSSDGYYFTRVNPRIIDALLRIGAVAHKHDAHTALADPALAMTLAAPGSGGAIPAALKIYVTYTLIDADGGETLPLAAANITTPAGVHRPTTAPTLAPTTGGTLTKAAYDYGISITDSSGGETAISPLGSIYGSGAFIISGLTALTTAASGGASGTGWRIWRRANGGPLYLIATGVEATDTFTDTGVSGDCTISPPRVDTTSSTNSLHVTVPGGQPSGTVQFAIYASANGTFISPALLGVYPAADLGTMKTYTSLLVGVGSPPAVSRCYPGAANINAETEVNHLHWWKPVADQAALAAVTSMVDGDTRVVLDTHLIYTYDGSDWERSPCRWPVADFASLPTLDLRDGDVCMTLDTHVTWIYDGTAWRPPSMPRQTALTAISGLVAATETAETLNMVGNSMKVYSVTVDAACRVRLYPTAALATADIARGASADPDVAAQNGCYYEHTFSGAGTHILTPVVDAVMQEGTLAHTIAANVSMAAGGAVNVTLHGYRIE